MQKQPFTNAGFAAKEAEILALPEEAREDVYVDMESAPKDWISENFDLSVGQEQQLNALSEDFIAIWLAA